MHRHWHLYSLCFYTLLIWGVCSRVWIQNFFEHKLKLSQSSRLWCCAVFFTLNKLFNVIWCFCYRTDDEVDDSDTEETQEEKIKWGVKLESEQIPQKVRLVGILKKTDRNKLWKIKESWLHLETSDLYREKLVALFKNIILHEPFLVLALSWFSPQW